MKHLSSLALSCVLEILEEKHIERIFFIIQILSKTWQGNNHGCEDQVGGALYIRQGLEVIKLKSREELQVKL